MEKEKIIIIGNGHLAQKLNRKLVELGKSVLYMDSKVFAGYNLEDPKADIFERELQRTGIGNISSMFILDDNDSLNIELALISSSMNDQLSVYITLYNNVLAKYIHDANKNIYVFNPGEISAPMFVDALQSRMEETIITESVAHKLKIRDHHKINGPLWLALASLLGIIFFSSAFFYWSEKLSWVDAIYFTTTMATTVGFGDISLINSTTMAKLAGIFTMISSLAMVSIITSLFIDHLMKKRHEAEQGRKKIRYSNHVVVCGLGRVGYRIVQELIKQGEKVLVIEVDKRNKFLEAVRESGARVLIGDARIDKIMYFAGVDRAAGFIAAVDNDLINLEVGLNARAVHPRMPIVFRIFDDELAKNVKKQFNIKLVLSTTSIVSDFFVDKIKV